MELTVLTPLLRTEYYQSVESQLLTGNFDFYDLIHTVFPTKLSIKEFYKEYGDLMKKGFRVKRDLLC